MSTQSKWLCFAGILAAGVALLAFGVPTQYVLIGGLLLCCPLMMLFMGGMQDGPKKDQSGASSDTLRDGPGKESNKE